RHREAAMSPYPPRDAHLPVTAAQHEVWLAHQLDPKSCRYRLGQYLDITGGVDPIAFTSAVRRTVTEAAPLRARFVAAGDGVRQVIVPDEEPRGAPAGDPAHPWTSP